MALEAVPTLGRALEQPRPFPFSDPKLQAAITRALIKPLPGESFAVVVVADENEARFTVAVRGEKFGGQWSFGGYLDKEYRGDLTYGVEFRFSA